MTKEEIWEKLELEFRLRGLSPGTLKSYKCSIGVFLDWANKPYEDLGEDDLRNYLVYLIEENRLKLSTINSINAAIRFYLIIILEKDINYRRVARLRKPHALPDIWSKEEVKRFLSIIDDPRDLAIYTNVYGSGLRVSEIVNLKIEDVDSKNMRLFIQQSKNNKDRYTVLSKQGLNALRRYWRICRPVNPQNWLFPGATRTGNLGTRGVEKAFKKYKRKAAITKPGNIHMLRHCFATHALEAGTDTFYIKQLLGHSCFSSTAHYLHVAKTSIYKTESPADSLK